MASSPSQKILIVDDEHASDLMRSIRRRLESEGYATTVVEPDVRGPCRVSDCG